MALIDEVAMAYNKQIYTALMKGKEEEVIRICERIPKGPLHILTIHQDTVLHTATYSKLKDLAISLLNMVPESHFHKLTWQNKKGNTILHEAATSDKNVSVAKEMLRKAPALLGMPNKSGEMAIFRAATYGKNNMYALLDAEMNKTVQTDEDLRRFHFSNDKTSILHASVLAEHFDLALEIAEKYTYLIDERDGDGMTALQLLSCNPAAFYSRGVLESLAKFIYPRVSTTGAYAINKEDPTRWYRVPLWEEVRGQKRRYESAKQLAMFLVEKDTSWVVTEAPVNKNKPKIHKYGRVSVPAEQVQKSVTDQESTLLTFRVAETPLFLATKFGCTEIVDGILQMYPQAVEHVDEHGRNILHIAIKYRQIQILNMVEKMGTPMRSLVKKIDDDGNTILHMVANRAETVGDKDMRIPAVILHEDLLLFERVKKITINKFVRHYNSEGQTAEKLFAINYAQLREDAKEWMKRTSENCSIVAVLIATVAFAAAYTVPGGPNPNGYPVLVNEPFFVVYTTTDVLSLAFALTSVIIFLSILTSNFKFTDFQSTLLSKLMLGISLLILSVTMMMLAFAATIILLIRNKEKWTKVALYAVVFFPVLIFVFWYLPFYFSLLKAFKYPIKKIFSACPRCSNQSVHLSRVGSSTYQTRSSMFQTTRALV